MLNLKRQILIALLNEKEGKKSQELAKQLNVTQRTIRNNIIQLNNYFGEDIIKYKRPLFFISNRQKVADHIANQDQLKHYPNYPKDRPFLVFFQIYKNNHIRVEDLSIILHIGRNEIESTIKQLKVLCLDNNLRLEPATNGITLKGKQIWKNYLLAHLLINRISRLVKNQYLNIIFHNNFNINDFYNYLRSLDTRIKNKYKIKMSDRNLYILTIMHFLNSSN